MSDSPAHNPRQAAVGGTVIPKEQMTAYQRWELSSFDQSGELAGTGIPSLAATGEQQRIQKQARDDGYASGHAAGYGIGHDAGYTAGIQQAQSEASRIHHLLQNVQEELSQMDQQVVQSLLDLSLSVAHKMVRETLRVKPEVVLEIIREAVGILPHFNQNAHLVLHPEDAELVRKHMNDELAHAGWKIFTDAQIQRGGCLVKTAHSIIDATTEERWKRILQSVGQDHSWLA
jgi:flagellar assembly protein FliH